VTPIFVRHVRDRLVPVRTALHGAPRPALVWPPVAPGLVRLSSSIRSGRHGRAGPWSALGSRSIREPSMEIGRCQMLRIVRWAAPEKCTGAASRGVSWPCYSAARVDRSLSKRAARTSAASFARARFTMSVRRPLGYSMRHMFGYRS
jgi:hypothetical protein